MLELGPDPISIGLWVGGASTPNKRRDANHLYRELTGRNSKSAEYNLIVMKCPCCGSAIGKVDSPTRQKKVIGIVQTMEVLIQREHILLVRIHIVNFMIQNSHCMLLMRIYSSFVQPLF